MTTTEARKCNPATNCKKNATKHQSSNSSNAKVITLWLLAGVYGQNWKKIKMSVGLNSYTAGKGPGSILKYGLLAGSLATAQEEKECKYIFESLALLVLFLIRNQVLPIFGTR